MLQIPIQITFFGATIDISKQALVIFEIRKFVSIFMLQSWTKYLWRTLVFL